MEGKQPDPAQIHNSERNFADHITNFVVAQFLVALNPAVRNWRSAADAQPVLAQIVRRSSSPKSSHSGWRPEWASQGAERAVAVRVEPRGERRPARGAEEGVEVLRWRRVRRRFREGVRFEERALRLEFPGEAFRGGRAPVLVFDVDEVEASRVAGG